MKNSKINILGTNYVIKNFSYGEMFDYMGYSVSGFIDYDKKLIGYSGSKQKDVTNTLLHEFLHGLFYESGFDVDNEENLIEFLVRHMDKIINFKNSLVFKSEDKNEVE